jgi:hypothetical protein
MCTSGSVLGVLSLFCKKGVSRSQVKLRRNHRWEYSPRINHRTTHRRYWIWLWAKSIKNWALTKFDLS